MNRVLLLISITLLILYFIPTYTNPKIIKTVLTKDECDHIKQVASKKLHASTVSKSRNIDETIRKSETAWI